MFRPRGSTWVVIGPNDDEFAREPPVCRRGMIKGGIAIPAGSSKYLEAQPCPRNSLKLQVKLHS